MSEPKVMASSAPDISDSDNSTVKSKTHEKKIIKNGKMGIQVDSIDNHHLDLTNTVKKYGGYIASEKLSNTYPRTTLDLTIRVPAINFEKLVEEIEKGKGTVLFKNINARDVTTEFMDLESRLATKRKFIDRYHELLKKANEVKDMLEIEENLRKLQEEVESSEGRLKFLVDQVDFSTLDLTVNQARESEVKIPGFGKNIVDSVKTGWQILITIFLFIIKIWPIILLYVFVWYGIKKFWKRYKARRETLNKND
jgi:hypothetical protein